MALTPNAIAVAEKIGEIDSGFMAASQSVQRLFHLSGFLEIVRMKPTLLRKIVRFFTKSA